MSVIDVLAQYAPLMGVTVSLASFFLSIFVLRKAKEVNTKANEIHVLINSRMSELLALTGRASHAEGVEQGRNEVMNPTLP
jgi:hypothetical protein